MKHRLSLFFWNLVILIVTLSSKIYKMTNQIQKTALKIILGAFILASAVACNNKANDKKSMKDSSTIDTGLHKRPTDPGN